MKRLFRDLIVLLLLLAILMSTFLDIGVDDFFMGTIYTVSGIMFSIGISILVTFNLQGIKKKSFIDKVRNNLNKVRNTFIYYFSFSTVFFILERSLRKSEKNIIVLYDKDELLIDISISFVVTILIFYSIFYFILNFLEVQKLNNQIFDHTNLHV
jgi:hypothetical protein